MSDANKTLVDQRELLQLVGVLRDRLVSTPARVFWEELWKALNLFEVIAKTQEQIVEDAEKLLEWLGKLEDERQVEVDATTKTQLREIVDGREGERERYFALALFWRRHAVWYHLHVKATDAEGGLQLVSRYLIASTKDKDLSETCYPRPTTAAEATSLVEIADLCRDRLRRLDRWLKEHPEATAKLNDKQNKGKGREVDAAMTEQEAAHFRSCLSEIESLALLQELSKATGDWLDAYESRLVYLGKLKEELRDVPDVLERQGIHQGGRSGAIATNNAQVSQRTCTATSSEIRLLRKSLQQTGNQGLPPTRKSVGSESIPVPPPSTQRQQRVQRAVGEPSGSGRNVTRSPITASRSLAAQAQDSTTPTVRSEREPVGQLAKTASRSGTCSRLSTVKTGRTLADQTQDSSASELPSEHGAVIQPIDTVHHSHDSNKPPDKTAHDTTIETRSITARPASNEQAIRAARRRTMERGTSPIPELLLVEEPQPVITKALLHADDTAGVDSQSQQQSQSTGTDSQNTAQSGVSSTFQDHSPPSPTSLPNISPSPPPPPGQSRPQPLFVPSSRATTPPSVIRPVSSIPMRAPPLVSSNSNADLSVQLDRMAEQHQPFLSLGAVRSSPTLVSSDPLMTRLPAPYQTRTFLSASTSSKPDTVQPSDTPRSRKPVLEVVRAKPVPSPEKRLVEAAARDAERKRKLASLTEEPSYSRLFEGLQMVPMAQAPAITKKKRISRAEGVPKPTTSAAPGLRGSGESGEKHSPQPPASARRSSLAVSTFSDIDGSDSSQGARQRKETEDLVDWLSQEENQ